MEINKQLFEDVLSGKLKGTFVLRNGKKLNSSLLLCSGNIDNRIYAIGTDKLYYDDGAVRTYPYKPSLDIIDFIPDADMKEKELTIEILKGKIVDWDESKKQNKIVLKNKQLTYKDVCEKLFSEHCYFIDSSGIVEHIFGCNGSATMDKNNATTEHQLECILAKNKLANIAKYLNNGWKPNKGEHVFYLTCFGDFENKVYVGEYCLGDGENVIVFKTSKLAQQAIEILGEETVKLALEPLGI